MVQIGRRRFMAAGLSGIGATRLAGRRYEHAPAWASAQDPPSVTQLRMIIRGLVAYVIYPTHVDVLLMDERKMAHYLKHEARIGVEVDSSSDQGGAVLDDTKLHPVRLWSVRGQVLTIGTGSQFAKAEPATVAFSADTDPWESFGAVLDFQRVHRGELRTDLDTAADGHVAGIVRLLHGRLQGAIPSRAAGNLISWEVTGTDGRSWQQHLTDTVLFTLDVPSGSIEVARQPLARYQRGANEPSPVTDTLSFRPPRENIIFASLDHDVENGRAELDDLTLRHNEVFYGLFHSPPSNRPVPKYAAKWSERGLKARMRSPIWLTEFEKQQIASVEPSEGLNKTDPNCNCAYVRGRQR